MPEYARQSTTLDNGNEHVLHKTFGIQAYFADKTVEVIRLFADGKLTYPVLQPLAYINHTLVYPLGQSVGRQMPPPEDGKIIDEVVRSQGLLFSGPVELVSINGQTYYTDIIDDGPGGIARFNNNGEIDAWAQSNNPPNLPIDFPTQQEYNAPMALEDRLIGIAPRLSFTSEGLREIKSELRRIDAAQKARIDHMMLYWKHGQEVAAARLGPVLPTLQAIPNQIDQSQLAATLQETEVPAETGMAVVELREIAPVTVETREYHFYAGQIPAGGTESPHYHRRYGEEVGQSGKILPEGPDDEPYVFLNDGRIHTADYNSWRREIGKWKAADVRAGETVIVEPNTVHSLDNRAGQEPLTVIFAAPQDHFQPHWFWDISGNRIDTSKRTNGIPHEYAVEAQRALDEQRRIAKEKRKEAEKKARESRVSLVELAEPGGIEGLVRDQRVPFKVEATSGKESLYFVVVPPKGVTINNPGVHMAGQREYFEEDGETSIGFAQFLETKNRKLVDELMTRRNQALAEYHQITV